MKSKFTLFIVFAVLTLFSTKLFSQPLSGTYTIGGTSPDFATITDAVDTITANGMSGAVVFNIRNGTYYENITIDSIPGNYLYPLTFQSETGDSSAVIIEDTDNYFSIISLLNVKDVNFKSLTFLDYSKYSSNCITANDANFSVKHCFFNSTYNGRNDALISITGNSAIIDSCSLYGGDYAILCKNNKLIFEKNILNSFVSPFKIVQGKTYFIRNNIYKNAQQSSSIDTSISGVDSIFLQNNVFSSLTILYSGWVDLDSNIINNANLSYDTTVILNKNVISDLFLLYGGNDIITRNSIYNMNVSYMYTLNVFNNEMSGNLSFFAIDTIRFYHNNVNDTAGSGFGACEEVNVRNNNFNIEQLYSGINVIISDYNNYYPYDSIHTEPHSVSFDPQYVSSTNLTVQNPLLIGKGADLLSEVPFDIDSLPRRNPPTIGANELCLPDSGAQSENITIICGDSITLSLCDNNDSYTYSWQPVIGLSNSSIPNPVLAPGNSGKYVCTIKSGNTIIESDTINVTSNSFQVKASDDTTIEYCGYGLFLEATYNASASYQWTPSTGLSNSTIRNPFANPYITTTYTVEATVPGCGVSYDSVIVIVNPLPVAYCYVDSQYHNWIEFLNVSTCAESYLWIFCDSTTDTATNPIHIFTDTGYCLVTLIACNSYGCDTFSGYVYIDAIKVSGIVSPSNNTNSLQVFPNPTNDILNILLGKNANESEVQIEVLDMLGKCHYNEDFNSYNGSFEQKIDLSNLAKGIYIVKVKAGEDNYYRKIVLQ